MSKIHILESDNDNGYRAVIHFAVAAGNNAVGLSWQACGLASGKTGTTAMTVGTDPGDITQTEYNSIIAGSTAEIVRTINPGMSPTNAAVEAMCDIEIAEWNADTGRILKYYGHKIEA